MSTRLESLSFRKGLAFMFLAGFLVRLVPELLAFPHPIGFDTIHYAAAMKEGVIWPHWSTFFTSSWLFYAVSAPLYRALSGDPILLLKILAPALFGLNAAGIYWFAVKMLGWNTRLGLSAGAFYAFQLASLRISWDLLRNTLGLGILLFALPIIRNLNSKRGFACFACFALLSVFAHEYAAVTLSAIVLGLVLWPLLKGETLTEKRRLALAFTPALLTFLAGLYLRLFPIHYRVETNIVDAGDEVHAAVGGLFFLVDYMKVKTSVDTYASYINLLLSVAALFFLLYMPYIFLVWKGFFKNRVLSLWTGLLSAGAFGCLLFPFCALDCWHRWMFMLVYPFTFYAVNGFGKCLQGFSVGLRCRSRKASGMVLASVMLGCAYLATPFLMSTVNVGIFSLNPVNRYISFAPTVPYQDVDGVVEAMDWLNRNLGEDSCVLLQHAFLFWGQLYLDNAHTIVHFVSNVDLAVKTAHEHGFSHVYFVWWNKPIGWYGVTVPEDFTRLMDFGRISVYEHV